MQHRVSRDLHAIARNRTLTGLALGYVPEGEPIFGIDRASLAQTSPHPYAILFCMRRPGERRNGRSEHWMALGEALDRRGLRMVLPWGTAIERARSEAIAAAADECRSA